MQPKTAICIYFRSAPHTTGLNSSVVLFSVILSISRPKMGSATLDVHTDDFCLATSRPNQRRKERRARAVRDLKEEAAVRAAGRLRVGRETNARFATLTDVSYALATNKKYDTYEVRLDSRPGRASTANGTMLRDRVHACKGLSLKEAMPIVRQLMLMLVRLASYHNVHGQLSACSIILLQRRENRLGVLLDGAVIRPVGVHEAYSRGQTGTPSPQVLMCEADDETEDMFGLGCLVYFMLTGHELFVGDTRVDLLADMLITLGAPARLPLFMRELSPVAGKCQLSVYALLLRYAPNLTAIECTFMADFVDRCIRMEPTRRLTLTEAFLHIALQ
jgi:serine/threonine protein kinase